MLELPSIGGHVVLLVNPSVEEFGTNYIYELSSDAFGDSCRHHLDKAGAGRRTPLNDLGKQRELQTLPPFGLAALEHSLSHSQWASERFGRAGCAPKSSRQCPP